MASRMLVVVSIFALLHCVLGNQQLERQARELFSRRQQLAKLKRLVNEWDQQLSHLQKRTCNMGLPGALEGCDANNAWNSRLDKDYINSINSPGKRNACTLGLNGFMDGCDAQSALEALKAQDFLSSLQSPGKRQAGKQNCREGPNGLICDDSNSEDSPRN